jgi:hypothetical protein
MFRAWNREREDRKLGDRKEKDREHEKQRNGEDRK